MSLRDNAFFKKLPREYRRLLQHKERERLHVWSSWTPPYFSPAQRDWFWQNWSPLCLQGLLNIFYTAFFMCIVADAVAGHPILTSMAIGLFSFSWWAGNSTPQLISADAGMRLIWISVIILAFAAVEPFMSGTAASLYW